MEKEGVGMLINTSHSLAGDLGDSTFIVVERKKSLFGIKEKKIII